jgi:lysophospholipase L1-like esterase
MTPAGAARRRLRRLALALAALVMALGAAEWCARAFAPDWLRARMREVAVGRSLGTWGSDADWPVERDAGRIVRFMPGSEFTVRDDEYFHRVRIDEYGGRDPGRASGGAVPIVPVFGDSMTFGLGVADDETWVSLAGRFLPVRLVNFGMPGTDLLNQLDSLDRMHTRLASPPVCLFVVFLGNDLTTLAETIEPDTRDGTASASLSDRLFAVNRALDDSWMLRRWYVVQWARAMAVRAVNASRSEPQVQGMLALMDRAASLDRVRRAFEHAADRLLSEAARLRFTPAVLILPDHFQVEERVRRDKAALYGVSMSSYDPRRPNRIVTEALASRGVAFIDASACLEGRTGQYYVRDGHFTAAGHRTIADCTSPFIVERWAATIP